MNAAIATQRPIWAAGQTLQLGRTVAASLALARERFNRLSWRRGLLAATALAASLLVIAWVVAVPTSMAYLGVFGFSALANAVLFLPSGRGAVMVAGALTLDPSGRRHHRRCGRCARRADGICARTLIPQTGQRSSPSRMAKSLCRQTHGCHPSSYVHYSEPVHGRSRDPRREAPLPASAIPDILPYRKGGPVDRVRVLGPMEHLPVQLLGRFGVSRYFVGSECV